MRSIGSKVLNSNYTTIFVCLIWALKLMNFIFETLLSLLPFEPCVFTEEDTSFHWSTPAGQAKSVDLTFDKVNQPMMN